MASTDDDRSVLRLRLEPGPRPVSALSSFLRTLQAAVRETAANDSVNAILLDQRPGPTLAAEIDADAGSIVVSFRFRDPTGEPIDALSRAAFAQFVQEVSSLLVAQPQRDLWGAPVFASKPGNDERERAREVLEDLTRLGNASIELGRRRIKITGGSPWLTEG